MDQVFSWSLIEHQGNVLKLGYNFCPYSGFMAGNVRTSLML